MTHSFSWMNAAGSFSLIVIGEILWGVAVGWAMLRIRRALHNTSLEVSLSLLTPFVAFLPAESMGGTGVLAAVASGLYVGYMSSHWVRATTRLQLVPGATRALTPVDVAYASDYDLSTHEGTVKQGEVRIGSAAAITKE